MNILEELRKKIADIEIQNLAMEGCSPTFTVSEIMDLIDSVETDKQTAESAQNVPNDDLISKKAAIDAINTWDKFGVDERGRLVRWHEGLELYVHLRDVLTAIVNLPSAQPDEKLRKIADLVEGSIDHFDRDDAMDLLYQIKEIVRNETSNIRG